MLEIIGIIEDSGPLTDSDYQQMQRIKKELGSVWCHRCDYCKPCPEDIPISLVLNLKSMVKRMPHERLQSFLSGPMEKARNCRECEECMERCPYKLNIPELIRKNLSRWDRYVQTGVWEETI